MQALLAPLAFGLLLFYALDPGVDALERRRVPRWIGAALMIFVTLGVVLGGAYALQDQALTVINQLPAGARRISAMMEPRSRQEPSPLDKVQQAAEELSKPDTLKPKPGVVRVQVEEPRVTYDGHAVVGLGQRAQRPQSAPHDSVSDLLRPAFRQDVQEEVRRARSDADQEESHSKSSTTSRPRSGGFFSCRSSRASSSVL